MKKEKVVVLTGAGMSAESGLKTFRDANGLWEGHDVMQVASPEGFARNPELVLEFYNQRRRQLKEVSPNAGHLALVKLEQQYEVEIITQNVDNLHEAAGSSSVLHLHGELFKVRSTVNEDYILDWTDDLLLGNLDQEGNQLRPHIVWFGEMVPLMDRAVNVIRKANKVIIVGTSMQVYPAAGLLNYAPAGIPKYFIDPKPSITSNDYSNLKILNGTAARGLPVLVNQLLSQTNER
ncbi:NAD-dependent protein deacylase [Croceivirga radicis]|uniref:NAD-dependent protein deacylase n=1 Tax=Croceivirga radicis TaxID=1929488 RepID=A0A1V6LTX4_9FLAO|nr:NAD-dependent deacylase [Croceivirga radicis]OQD43446.1 NAD-dependent protein deacylase [Croceivirga radicis]